MKLSRKNIFDTLIILLVFALTGLTTLFASSLIIGSLGFEKWSFAYVLSYIFLIFPLYHILLLGYAFIFGKYNFFMGRIKKTIQKIHSFIS